MRMRMRKKKEIDTFNETRKRKSCITQRHCSLKQSQIDGGRKHDSDYFQETKWLDALLSKEIREMIFCERKTKKIRERKKNTSFSCSTTSLTESSGFHVLGHRNHKNLCRHASLVLPARRGMSLAKILGPRSTTKR